MRFSLPDHASGTVAGVALAALVVAYGAAPAYGADLGPARVVSHVVDRSDATGSNGRSTDPAISDDGTLVAFISSAGGLVEEVPDSGVAHVYLWDAGTGTTTLVDRAGAGASDGYASSVAISPDGATVVFASSARNLDDAAVEGIADTTNVFAYDVATGALQVVSTGTADGSAVGGNNDSTHPDVSATGAFVTFTSVASDLVAGDADEADVFLWERATGTLQRLSGGGRPAFGGRISDDGTAVVWTDGDVYANPRDPSLGPDDVNGEGYDIYRYDIATGVRQLVTLRDGFLSGPTGGNASSYEPEVSDDGAVITFVSQATNLDPAADDANDAPDVYVWQRDADGTAITLVSRTADGRAAGVPDAPIGHPRHLVSGDGSGVLWASAWSAETITGSDTDAGGVDVFLSAPEAGAVERVSRPVAGDPGGDAYPVGVSDDAAVVAFVSTGDSAEVAGVPDASGGPCAASCEDLYAWIRDASAPLLVSSSATDTATADAAVLPGAVLAGDGSRVAWASAATDVVRDQHEQNVDADVFARDLTADDVLLEIGDAEGVEGDEGDTEIPVVLTRTFPGRAATVDYATSAGTARSDTDYVEASGTATFASGETTTTITVEVVGDAVAEDDETFRVVLSDPIGVVLDRGAATVTIVDDDGAATVVVDIPGGAQNSTTAVQWSRLAFPDGFDDTGDDAPQSGEVLLASETAFPDALASGSLQATSPLLLTDPTQLEDEVLAELQRLGASTVRILGGDRAVSTAVDAAVADAGIDVVRTFGPTRLETATEIAALQPGASTAILARAFPAEGAADPTQAFADSLAAGGWAAAAGIPVLLTETHVLSTSTRTYLEGSQIREVLVVGGEAAIAPAVLDALGTLGIQARRVAGVTRFHTAVDTAAERGFASEDDADVVLLVEGQAPDAWAAGFAAAASAARFDAPIVLANGPGLPEPTATFLSSGTPEPAPEGIALVCATTVDACQSAQGVLGLPPGTRGT